MLGVGVKTTWFAFFASACVVASHELTGSSGWDLPADCRNQSWVSKGGKLVPMSWHIHYTTNSSDMKRFYDAFVAKYQSLFPPAAQGDKCPFGPNYGSYAYKYICSLESALEDEFELVGNEMPPPGGGPWTVVQRAFFVPVAHVEAAWAWVSQPEVRGQLDVLLHANTGCMHDDHGLRGTWLTPGRSAPSIRTLNFPCNMAGTGCLDSKYSGPPSCGCSLPLTSDAPQYSCKNCVKQELPPSPSSLVV